MTRTSRDQIVVPAKNDIYTALAAVACVVTLIGLIVLFTQSSAVFNAGPFSGESAQTSMR